MEMLDEQGPPADTVSSKCGWCHGKCRARAKTAINSLVEVVLTPGVVEVGRADVVEVVLTPVVRVPTGKVKDLRSILRTV